jgi:hypothetical protein
VSFIGMTGGVNISQAPEQIADTEMQQAQNFIYAIDSKRLKGRGGLGLLNTTDETIRDMWYDVDTNVLLLFTTTFKVYRYVMGQTPIYIGKLNGSYSPMCAKFMDKIWIASGGKLQYYDYTQNAELQTVGDSPTCSMVFQRFSRIAVSQDGTNGFYLSSVGDGTEWAEDTNRADKEQWLDVGYGDSGTITAIVPLATDIIFIKSNGKIYQLSGDADPNDWQVTEIANGTDPAGTNCAVNIGNSVVFLSIRGLKSLAAVMEYGNIATADIGDKFNGLITENMYEPRFYHLQRHSLLLIRPTSDYSYFVAYNYQLGSATTLKFNMDIDAICETNDDILVSSENKIYQWDDRYTDDDGKKIEYVLQPKATMGMEQMLMKAIDTKFSSDYSGKATVQEGTLKVSVPTDTRNKIKCNHSTDYMDITITSNDRFIVDHIMVEVADL